MQHWAFGWVASALAYALAKLYRREGTLTVIGGPHARSFPADRLRFFDWVVLECDKTLIGETSSPMDGVRVAMILHNGMPVELLEFKRP